MSINIHKLKKWTKMMIGNSSYHVNQDEGKIYSVKDIKGYYNNLTEKITKYGLDNNEIPSTIIDTGDTIYFSIAIFQYGLAAYDLYLMNNNDKDMLSKAISCANWAINNQNKDGSWDTFTVEKPDYPFSSMAQGEAISLLIRTYLATNNKKYINAVKKAYRFMIKPVKEGGTAKYDNNNIYFYECTDEPLILNGWIFSIWGIYDYNKFFKDKESKKILDKSIETLVNKLPEFDIKYWSKYDDNKRICSPFYHKLHISQLKVMYQITKKPIFKEYSEKWEKYYNKKNYRIKAFVKKSIQKLFEK